MLNTTGQDRSLIKTTICQKCSIILEYLPIDIEEK